MKHGYAFKSRFFDVEGPYVLLTPGKGDRALESLERAFVERSINMPWLIEPTWDSLPQDPRFQDLVRRVGFGG